MKKLVSLLIICASVVGATVSVFAYSDTDNSSYKSSIDELSQLGIIRTAHLSRRKMSLVPKPQQCLRQL